MPFAWVADPPEFPIPVGLTYRGVPYYIGPTARPQVSLDPFIAAVSMESSVAVSAPVTVSTPVIIPPVQSVSPDDVERAGVKQDAQNLSVKERMRMLLLQHVRNIRRREQAMLARADEKVGLPPESAAHHETSIQGKVPHYFSGYDRSSASMS